MVKAFPRASALRAKIGRSQLKVHARTTALLKRPLPKPPKKLLSKVTKAEPGIGLLPTPSLAAVVKVVATHAKYKMPWMASWANYQDDINAMVKDARNALVTVTKCQAYGKFYLHGRLEETEAALYAAGRLMLPDLPKAKAKGKAVAKGKAMAKVAAPKLQPPPVQLVIYTAVGKDVAVEHLDVPPDGQSLFG
mmetsp:Transcript_11218/g.20466  ORF Transcript_11218/g.20466 Transcript_11218/m.20466 type:complete len:193 (-) Transcript_11218:163-741(-)